MSIKDILPGKKEEKLEYIWSLVIEPGWVQAGIWRIRKGKAEIVFSGPSSAWELDKELVDKVDTALSSAIQNYPEGAKEPDKCVFGVVSSWVSDGQIKDTYLSKLKKICTDLSLTPVGFVVLPEAIAHNVKLQEGSPLSACVLGVYGQSIEITLFKLGDIVGNTTVARSVSIIDDLSEGLTRLGVSDTLPSRFVLYDGKEGELEEARQSLLKANWDDFDKFKFLHTPKVEVVKPDEKIEAVSLAGASEMAGVSVLRDEESKDVLLKKEIEKGGKRDSKRVDGVSDGYKHEMSPEDLGFVLEEDIDQKKVAEEEVRGKDVFEKEVDDEESNVVPVKVEKGKLKVKGALISRILLKVGKVRSSIFGETGLIGRFRTSEKRHFVIGFFFFILILVFGFVFWWFFPKATVTVYVSPHSLREKISLEVDANIESSDYGEGVLKGNVLETSVSGEKTKSTSGTKVVGERAKGEVVVYRVGSELDLSAGVVLQGPGNLKFSLDENVTLASGSASSPGSTKVRVTASEVGSEYNLAVGTNFTVGNYSTSDLEAKNEESFSGGTSYEINAVSAQDQKDVLADLRVELKDIAKNKLVDMLPEDDFYVDGSIIATVSSRIFDKKVGDEASSVKLNLTLSATCLVVNKSELLELSRLILKDKIPEGFVLRDEQIELSFESVENTGPVYDLELTIDTNLLPEIDTDEIVEKIRGKYPPLARDYLTREVSGFVRAEVRLRPNLPGKLGTLPRVAENIEIEVAAEK
jgi:hypothetical protein